MNATLLAGLPLPQRLALSYAPAAARDANLALLALDARLGAILRSRLEPIAAQLRLAWWREMLERPVAEWPVGEPLLQALRAWRDPSSLATLPAGWEALLGADLDDTATEQFAQGRADAFGGLAKELGSSATGPVTEAARTWALADLAANLPDGAERQRVIAAASGLSGAPLPRALRPLAVLAGLGRNSLLRGGAPLLGGPGCALLALRIGLTGR